MTVDMTPKKKPHTKPTTPKLTPRSGKGCTFMTVRDLYTEKGAALRVAGANEEERQERFLTFVTKRLKLTLIPGIGEGGLSQFVCKEDYEEACDIMFAAEYASEKAKRERKKVKDAEYNRKRREKQAADKAAAEKAAAEKVTAEASTDPAAQESEEPSADAPAEKTEGSSTSPLALAEQSQRKGLWADKTAGDKNKK